MCRPMRTAHGVMGRVLACMVQAAPGPATAQAVPSARQGTMLTDDHCSGCQVTPAELSAAGRITFDTAPSAEAFGASPPDDRYPGGRPLRVAVRRRGLQCPRVDQFAAWASAPPGVWRSISLR